MNGWLVNYLAIGLVWLLFHVGAALLSLGDPDGTFSDEDRYRILSTLWMPFLWPLGLLYGVFWLARHNKRKAGL